MFLHVEYRSCAVCFESLARTQCCQCADFCANSAKTFPFLGQPETDQKTGDLKGNLLELETACYSLKNGDKPLWQENNTQPKRAGLANLRLASPIFSE